MVSKSQQKRLEIQTNETGKRLICLVGLPRSGKSTLLSKKKFPSPIVNPDSIRLALHGQRYVQAAEDFVWAIAKVMVKSLFLAGHNEVIIDATNNTRKRRDFWRSKEWMTVFIHINTPKEECIRRAKLTDDYDIIPVIERMADYFEPLEDDEILLDVMSLNITPKGSTMM